MNAVLAFIPTVPGTIERRSSTSAIQPPTSTSRPRPMAVKAQARTTLANGRAATGVVLISSMSPLARIHARVPSSRSRR
jgi:hypothetical protein